MQAEKKHQYVFPFSAIVGQDEMKTGLMLNIVDPKIGGVLVFGEKGTAKSTAVRAIAELLPEITVVKGCPFRCDPANPGAMCEECYEKYLSGTPMETEQVKMRVVDLPVSATEDRVVGSLDIEEAIKRGKKKFEPGVLAQANRGILYVDEINLLDDHIVDLLLDSAAMGVNTVEREGVSYSHPANFILVGTMNPEEGELRPQLLDRFGLSVEIKGLRNPEQRVQIVRLRSEFDNAPVSFIQNYSELDAELGRKIAEACKALPEVQISDEILLTDAKIAIALDSDGHRGDITMMKALLAAAALEGRKEVTADDILLVVKMVFLHRLKSLPFEKTKTFDLEMVRKIVDESRHKA